MGKREYKDTVFVDLFFHCEDAIDNCIKKDILSMYLRENRSGVMGLFLGEYDQNKLVETAKEESYNRGKLEGYKNTAKNLLVMGLPIEAIAKATGLSTYEIQKL